MTDQTTTATPSKMERLKTPGLRAAFSVIFTGIAFMAARDLQSGAEVNTSGRRSGVKKLFVSIADALGPVGVLVVGGLISAIMIGLFVKEFQKA